MATSLPFELDDWMPKHAIRTRHRRASACSPEALFAGASTVRLSDTGTIGRLVRWRIPGTPPELSFRELFARYPFTVLDEGETWSISGLVGRIWTLHRDYGEIAGAEDFLSWSKRGTCKVLFAHWAEPREDGGSTLCHEARIEPVDFSAGIRLRGIWAVVAPWEKLVGREALVIATRRAEELEGVPSPARARQAS